jgi:hypothetical protein
LPSSKPFVSASIACGWSPIGLKSECNTNLSIKPSLFCEAKSEPLGEERDFALLVFQHFSHYTI